MSYSLIFELHGNIVKLLATTIVFSKNSKQRQKQTKPLQANHFIFHDFITHIARFRHKKKIIIISITSKKKYMYIYCKLLAVYAQLTFYCIKIEVPHEGFLQ